MSSTNEAEQVGGRERVRSMHRPMRRAYIGNYLDRGIRPRKPLPTNIEVARFLMKASLNDLGGVPITESSPEADEHIARMMAAETVAALNRSGGKTSANWYTDAIRSAVGIAGMMHPELVSDERAREMGKGFKSALDARCVFFAAMAIASQNNAVPETTRYALEQYRHFLDHGRFLPKVYGQKGASVAGNLKRFNDLLNLMHGDVGQLREFLSTPYTMGELREVGERHGIRLGGRELLDETVYGSMLFGPKIGNGFYQNLMGNPAPVTVDLWLMRTFGRYTGTLVKGRISEAQVERLAATLAAAPEAQRDAMAGMGIDPDANVRTMGHDELVDLCRPLGNLWESLRRQMVRDGTANPEVSRIKSAMGWPGASDAIMKGLADTVDQPERPGDRRWIRAVAARALEILAVRGYRMTAADMQATLWYPERNLYGFLRGRDVESLNVSYDDALADRARKEGFDDDAIEQARGGRYADPSLARGAGLVADGSGRHGGPGTPGCGDPEAVQGIRDGADGAGQGTPAQVAHPRILTRRRPQFKAVPEDGAAPQMA